MGRNEQHAYELCYLIPRVRIEAGQLSERLVCLGMPLALISYVNCRCLWRHVLNTGDCYYEYEMHYASLQIYGFTVNWADCFYCITIKYKYPRQQRH